MNAKEQWIDDAMASLDNAEQASLSEAVREKIIRRALFITQKEHLRSTTLVWKLAAIILLLISLNLFTMIHLRNSAAGEANPVNSLAVEYFLYIGTYNF